MQGWLVVNAFLKTDKFGELYAFFARAAEKRGISLQVKTGAEIVTDVQSDSMVIKQNRPDFVLFWDKDVALARRLEAQGLRLFNSAKAVEACDNKIYTALALANAGVRMPKTFPAPKTFAGVGYCDSAFLDKAEKTCGYPMVVKEAYGSFGAQVYLARDRAELEKIVALIGHKEFLMQEYIAASRGKDVRVNVVGGKVVCAMLRSNADDFRSNITNGGRAQAYALTYAQEQTALAACAAVDADFAGVDILFGADGRPLVCEVNSNPHFKSTFDCTGVDLSGIILDHIRGEL